MQLSIIIVNYNVKYFLEYCLAAACRACQNISAEIFIVDNNSSDGSQTYIQEKFAQHISTPPVNFIENTINVGFAKANNQAFEKAKGKYILYLNPDTIVAEDCFEKCINFLEAHPEVGCLGPQLIDGKGVFLPESKRGFPSTKAAFFKITGLSNLFKHSKVFNQYHLGYLPVDAINKVDVLAGCFMMAPKAVLDKTGSFDEDYFMYGEDIDLSYVIQKEGYQNIYFPETRVIHFKGESTKKGSLNYVKLFYNAMIIFAKKHLSSSNKSLFILLLQFAIQARALLSIVNRFFLKLWLPLFDASIILTVLIYTKQFWASEIKQVVNFYNPSTVKIFFGVYILIWIVCIFFSGGYDTPLKKIKISRGMLIGTIITLAIYGLLPESIRFSRGITLVGAIISTGCIVLARIILQQLGVAAVQAENTKSKSILIVGDKIDYANIKGLLYTAAIEKDVLGYVTTQANDTEALGEVANLYTIAQAYKVGEIIFTQKDLSYGAIIDWITCMPKQYNFKMYTPAATSIIGSNSKHTAGDLYASDWHFAISVASGKRNKRVFDILLALSLLIFSPILFFIVKYKSNYFYNSIQILLGKYTWVGYNQKANCHFLPQLKPSIFELYTPDTFTTTAIDRINILYARNYTVRDDWDNIRKRLF